MLLSVTALGDLAGRRPVLRSGARPGDVIAVAGPLGRSAAGLALLSAGVTVEAAPEAVAGLIAAHRRPSPPYAAGPEAAALGATAMIDVSDGLLADLGHLADASAVALDLDSSSLVTAGPLSEAAAFIGRENSNSKKAGSYRTDPGSTPASISLEWMLTGGEDHSLVAAFPASTQLPSRWRVIGRVRAAAGHRPRRRLTVDARRTPASRLAALPLIRDPWPFRPYRGQIAMDPVRPTGPVTRQAGASRGCARWVRVRLLGRCRAGDLARLDAGGADVQALGRTGDDGPNGLDVRVPATTGTDVRVRHVVAEARPLAANVADGSHGCLQN